MISSLYGLFIVDWYRRFMTISFVSVARHLVNNRVSVAQYYELDLHHTLNVAA